MTTTRDFLLDVLPSDEPFYFAVTPWVDRDGVTKGLRHTALLSPEAVASYARGRTDDVYYAVAGFEHRYLLQADRRGREVKRRRVQENVTRIKSLILDIDVDPDKDKLAASKPEALKSFKKFLKETGFFKPSYIVDSGGGYHVYWCLDAPIDRDVWKAATFKFKRLLRQYGGPVAGDLTRVSDPSSILRVPGTLNNKKDEARQVRVVYPKDTAAVSYEFADIKAWLEDNAPEGEADFKVYKNQLAFPACPDKLRAVMRKFPEHISVDSFDGDFAAMRAGCALVAEHANEQGNVSEPFWYGFLGTLAAMPANDAEALAIEHSSGHPNFDEEATLHKLDQVRDAQRGNPITCTAFEERAMDGGVESPCATCVLRKKVTTPFRITAAMVEEHGTPEQSEQLEEAKAADEAAAAAPGEEGDDTAVSGFQLTARGLYAFFMKDVDEPGFYKVSNTPLTIDHAVTDHDTGEIEGYNLRVTRPDKEVNLLVPPGAFARNEQLVKHMLIAGVRFTDRDTDGLRCAKFLKRSRSRVDTGDMAPSIKRFGWHGKSLALGANMVSSGRAPQPVTVEPSVQAFAQKFAMEGNVRDWAPAVDGYLSHRLARKFALLVAISAGTPVMKMLRIPGVLVNIYGTTGKGKSLALMVAHSIWGKPLERVTGPTDTINYVMKGVAAYYNLPITFDEISNIDPADLSNFCYALTQGTERGSLTAERVARNPLSGWHTAVLSSSNPSMVARLGEGKLDPEAEQMRVLEIQTPKASIETSVAPLMDALHENHGVMGEVLAGYYTEDYEKISKVAKDLFVRKLEEKGSEHRFQIAALVCAQIGARLLHKAGLEKSMARNLIREIIMEAEDEALTAPQTKANGAFGFLRMLHAHCANAMAVFNDGKSVESGTERPMARVDFKDGKAMLSVRADVFASFCRTQNLRASQARSALKSEKLYAGNGLLALNEYAATRTSVERFNYHIIDPDMHKVSGLPDKSEERRIA